MGKERKSRFIKVLVFVMSVFVIFFSVSYAFLAQTLTGTKRQVIQTGDLSLELKEDNAIVLENAMPMYDEVGIIQEPFTFRLLNTGATNVSYVVKLVDETVANPLPTGLVKYGLTKDGVSNIDFVSHIKNNVLDKGVILGKQEIEYALRLWIDSDVEDEAAIKDKSLRYRIDVDIDQKVLESVHTRLFEDKYRGDNCTVYNDGVDTFLTGSCENNYVWYSGKLWRVVLKNNATGAVKMVTEGGMTAIGYNQTDNTAFENCYVDQWLIQEFLPTLHDYQDYLEVNSIWDATLDSSNAPARPLGTTTVQRAVGLLNAYEYYTARAYLNNSTDWWLMTPYSTSDVWRIHYDGSFVHGSLGNASYNIRPAVYLKSTIKIASGTGTQTDPYRLEDDEQEALNGTTLLSTRYSGEYIRFNDAIYRIVDVEEGHAKIRPLQVPEKLKKIVFANQTDNEKYRDGPYFHEATINAYLNTFYSYLSESYKNMIEENMTWYLGTVGLGESYKASICREVDSKINTKDCDKTEIIATTTIGLPRVGEIFTGSVLKGDNTDIWTLTKYRSNDNWYINNTMLSTDNTGYNFGSKNAIPSMYLKPNVVISKDNTGDGTYESPYDIELGQ